METIKNMQLAWKDDSFYVQTISTNGASILKAGAVGFLASRISGVGLPKDQAVFSIIYRITDIFLEYIEKKIIKKPLLSNEKDDANLRYFLRGIFSYAFTLNTCSLIGKKVAIFPLRELLSSRKAKLDCIKLRVTEVVTCAAINFTASLIFPKPRQASLDY